MFITMPIKSFKLKGNKVYVNESVIEYENISKDNHEILESMISKGAYGSALLTLNKLYNIKSINESKYTQEEYCKYLEECNNLMEECVIETKAHNFRPLINLNGLEIMENANNIARGKGDKLLIEDFRNNKQLKEDSFVEKTVADYIVEAIEEDYLSYEDVAKAALNYMSSDELEDMVRMNDFHITMVFDPTGEDEEMFEDCEGTQCSDIAEKKDQEVGSLQKPEKPKKNFTEMFRVPKNHGFKGFRLNEQGLYSRGNYILINENGNIKAVRKANIIDNNGTHIWDYNQVETEQAPRLIADMNKYLNNGFDIYDFGFRIEGNQLVVYDANEEFDFSYIDDKYELANKILQNLFGIGAYFEAELAPIGVVAGIEIRDLN